MSNSYYSYIIFFIRTLRFKKKFKKFSKPSEYLYNGVFKRPKKTYKLNLWTKTL